MDRSARRVFRVSSLLAGALELASCVPREAADGTHVGGLALLEDTVRWLAKRDEISIDEARVRATDTLRLVAASRDARTAEQRDEAVPELPLRRAAHLERSALARAYVETFFEPRHQPRDIPSAEVETAQARPEHVHPELHEWCHILAVPEEGRGSLDDPTWRATARATLTAFERRARNVILPGEETPCTLLDQIREFHGPPSNGVVLRFEQAITDLAACLVPRDADGQCASPAFDQTFAEAVRKAQAPGFAPLVSTPFGEHLPFLVRIRPAVDPSTPAGEQALREAIAPSWRREEMKQLLLRLREKHAVRVASDLTAAAPP